MAYSNGPIQGQNNGANWALTPWQMAGNNGQTIVGGPQNPSDTGQRYNQGVYTSAPQMGVQVRPVASYDEAKAVPTDFMGNMTIMPDYAHGYIYTKILNPHTGGPIFNVYRQVTIPEHIQPIPPEVPETPVYDAKSEIEQLRAELDSIKHELGITKEE